MADDSHVSIPVTWYFCGEDAQVFPHYTRFASGNWASSKIEWFGPGETSWRPRPWSDGEPPGPNPVRVIDSGLLRAPTNAVGSMVATRTYRVLKDAKILLYVLSVEFGGVPTGVDGVTDSAGNLYVRDVLFTDLSLAPVMEVWRADHTAPTANVLITVNFPGRFMQVTFGGADVVGLLAGAPIIQATAIGPAAQNPAVALSSTGHQRSFVFGVMLAPGMTALTSIPTGFSDFGRSVGAGGFLRHNGCGATFATGKPNLQLAWVATDQLDWGALALVYKGVPQFRLAGDHFCGPAASWADGAPNDAPALGADIYGMAPCCGGPLFSGCEFPLAFANMRITGVRDPRPGSQVFPGMVLTLSGNGAGWFTTESLGRIGGVIQQTQGNCVDGIWNWNTAFTPPGGYQSDSQSANPIALSFSGIPVSYLAFPAAREVWDFEITPTIVLP